MLHVDGLKTGHTESAGFNIIASSVDGKRRLIAVIMGGKSAKGCEEQARKLLIWGQNNFDTLQLFHAGKETGHENVWYGNPHQVAVGSDKDVYLALQRDTVKRIKVEYVVDDKDLAAPLKAHKQVGTIQIIDGDKTLAAYPLVTLQAVKQAGIVTRITEYIKQKL